MRLWLATLALLVCVGCSTKQNTREPSTAAAIVPVGDLPGAVVFGESLATELALARIEGPQEAATHLAPDGSPAYTNRLILETSPYLRQHAHNPIDWFAWGDDAFARAKALDRPVFLSIGYSTCHWCHVMADESFEDPAIATFLNTHFVAIKVDRESRPDVDEIYMKAVYALQGSGGWPATLVLTPDGDPFFADTYLPPRASGPGAPIGLIEVLEAVREAYANDRDAVVESAHELTALIRQLSRKNRSGALPGVGALTAAATEFERAFDDRNGGLAAGQTRFPEPQNIRLWLRLDRRSRGDRYWEMASKTLEAIARGGLHDHLGGGFHRYTVDMRWDVPHFEKMLYDNGQLLAAYSEAYRRDPRPIFEGAMRETYRWLAREMTSPDGAFFAATDAVSDGGKEGAFYAWTRDEVVELLGADGEDAAAFWQLDGRGEFGGKHILRIEPDGELQLPSGVESWRDTLYQARSKRPKPKTDHKIIASWNGLVIGGLARAGFVLDAPEMVASAENAARFVLTQMRDGDGRLYRTHTHGVAAIPGYLDDYANMIAGLLDLFEVTGDPEWLDAAIELESKTSALWDQTDGGFWMTGEDHGDLLAQQKPISDGGEPSGNGVMALNLFRLSELTTNDAYHAAGERVLEAFATVLRDHATSVPSLMTAYDWYLDTAREVVIVTLSDGADGGLVDILRRDWGPNRVQIIGPESALDGLIATVPWVRGKVARRDAPTAYVCTRGECELPTSSPEVFRSQLAAVVTYDSIVTAPKAANP